jgi:hypothetical protein
VGIEAARTPVGVHHRVGVHGAVARPDATEPSQALRVAEDLAFDEQTLLAVLVEDHARRPLAKRGIHVAVPDVDGLEDVTVCVDDLVRTCHGLPPFSDP